MTEQEIFPSLLHALLVPLGMLQWLCNTARNTNLALYIGTEEKNLVSFQALRNCPCRTTLCPMYVILESNKTDKPICSVC